MIGSPTDPAARVDQIVGRLGRTPEAYTVAHESLAEVYAAQGNDLAAEASHAAAGGWARHLGHTAADQWAALPVRVKAAHLLRRRRRAWIQARTDQLVREASVAIWQELSRPAAPAVGLEVVADAA